MTHVVMLVTNDVSTDTRVKKEALAVARMGLTVTVLGTTTEPDRWESRLGPVRIVRLPVAFPRRDARLERRAALRKARPFSSRRLRAAKSAAAARAVQTPAAHAPAVQAPAAPAPAAQAPAAHAPAVHAPAAQPAPPSVLWAAARRARRAARTLPRRARRLRREALQVRERATARGVVLTDGLLSRGWGAVDGRLGTIPYGARWRSILPEVLDYEEAFGPAIDELAPDVLHAHDMQVVGIAAQAAARARAAGRDVPWIYDAHEYVPGLSQYGGRTRRIIAAWADLEAEYIRTATHVVTVSPPISESLQQLYGLARTPAVVLNAPVQDPPRGPRPALREVMGLAADVPLVVYSGGVTKARGVHTAIDAMEYLPQAHLGIVCVPHNDTWAVRQLRPMADRPELAGRVHFLNPVRPGEVVDFLRSADVGLIPGLHFPSHEMSLTNKMFEYMNAGVPLAVSDCRTQAEFVRRYGVGEVFPAGDPKGLAEAVARVLADQARFAAAASDPELLDRYSWRRQEEVLLGVYAEVLGRPLSWVEGADDPRVVVDLGEERVDRVDRVDRVVERAAERPAESAAGR